MIKKDGKEFGNIINAAANIYSKELTREAVKIYWAILQRYTINDFRDAMTFLCGEPERQFFPKPNEISARIESHGKDYHALKRVKYIEDMKRRYPKLLPGK